MITARFRPGRARRKRISYRHRAQRIVDRAVQRDMRILLSQVPSIPPGTKVVVQNMPPPSKFSLFLASFEDLWANSRRYDPYDIALLWGVSILGLLVGIAIARFT